MTCGGGCHELRELLSTPLGPVKTAYHGLTYVGLADTSLGSCSEEAADSVTLETR